MNFGATEGLDTPYARAKQVWDDRLGSVRRQAHSWKMAAFASFVATIVMACGLIYQSSKAQVVPYVVEVDEVGKVRLVGTPATQGWEPSEAAVHFFLQDWVTKVRSLSSDREVVRSRWLAAYKAVTDRAKSQLDAYAQKTNPFERMGEQTRTVQIQSINAISDDSYRVEWTEEAFSNGGERIAEDVFVGTFKLARSEPKTVGALRENALGLYIDHFSWSQQIQGGNQ